MSKLQIYIFFIPAVLISFQCADDLKPGERNVPGFRIPIIEEVEDADCSDSTACPSKAENCAKKDFKVQKDTMYTLSAIFWNGDSTVASCRTCATVYKGDSVVMSTVTACPTGGIWMAHARLLPETTYTLVACLQRCPNLPQCSCGEVYISQAVISMRFGEYPIRWPPW